MSLGPASAPKTPTLYAAVMPKEKPRAQIMVADGEGGMRAVEDHRFDEGPWPLDFTVPAKDAEAWMAHLRAETEVRGWNASGIGRASCRERV